MPTNRPHRPPIEIWDRASRLWHWTIVLIIPAMWLTAEFRLFAIHRTLGILIAGAIVFRLFWGLFGSRTARFSSWLHSPVRIVTYARSLSRRHYVRTIGHNPLGALSVMALMLALITQTVSGLFAVDTDGINSGPLSRFVDFSLGQSFADIHETSFNILLGLIGLHLVAILLYALAKRINLVGPMLTGRVRAEGTGNRKPRAVALITGIALAAATAVTLFRL